MPNSEVVAKVTKYMEHLKREDKIRHALSRLEKVDMTLNLLQVTQVGKAVNQLCKHELYGDDALRIVTRWKEIARRNGIMPVKEETPSSSEDEYSQSDRSESLPPASEHSPSPPLIREQKRPKIEVKEEFPSPPQSSSTSGYKAASSHEPRKMKTVTVKKEATDAFSRMLATADTVAPKPKKPKTMEWSNDIDLNYRPFPVLNRSTSPKPAQEHFNPEQMFKPRNDRAKVFAGRRKGVTLTEVPRLFDICMRVVGNNVNVMDREMDGEIPFFILEPALEKCSVQQLKRIEDKNPEIEEDADKLWERFFTKAYPGVKKSKRETYKHAYFRMKQEHQDNFKAISEKISNKHRVEGGQTHKTAMIDQAYAPAHIRKKQAKHGTAIGNRALPTASEVSKARKQIFESGSSKSLAAIPSAVINRFSTVGAKKDSAAKKPVAKKGALMLKTMKMMNMKRR